MKICAECFCLEDDREACDYADEPNSPHRFVDVSAFDRGTIRPHVEGFGDNYSIVAGHTGAEIHIFIRDRETGKVAEEPSSIFTRPWDKDLYYWWSEGNGACDGNRMRGFGLKLEGDVCDHANPRYDIEIRRADDGAIIYTEWEER